MTTVRTIDRYGNVNITGIFDEVTAIGIVGQAVFDGNGNYSGTGAALVSSNSTAYTYSWTCPPGVTNISVVCVGAGGGGASAATSGSGAGAGGGGGGCAYANSISVTPGTVYTVVAGKGGAGGGLNSTGADGGISFFSNSAYLYANGGIGAIFATAGLGFGAGGTHGGTALTNGGDGGAGARATLNGTVYQSGGGGGGAGGYTGNGGLGNPSNVGAAPAGSGAGGGGGAGAQATQTTGGGGGGGGGGVGLAPALLNNGAGGTVTVGTDANPGGGGSGGANGANGQYVTDVSISSQGGNGGLYGGGGGGGRYIATTTGTGGGGSGGAGAVRIMWGQVNSPKQTRSYPNTNATDATVNSVNTRSKLYSNGTYIIDGQLDEVTITNFDGQVLSYNFTGNNATATFMGATISGNWPTTSSGGGTYTISNTGPYTIYGGSVGGNGGTQYASGGFNYGGAGGGIGGANATNNGGVGVGQDVSGLFAAAANTGYGMSNFGTGGGGGLSWSTPSQAYFPGGGGGGINSPYPVGLPGNGAVVVKYTTKGIDYYQMINQSAGAGTVVFPVGTTYVKMWTVGQGRRGNSASLPPGSGAGAGGVAYIEFSSTNKFTGYAAANGTVVRQYSNGSLSIAGTLSEGGLT